MGLVSDDILFADQYNQLVKPDAPVYSDLSAYDIGIEFLSSAIDTTVVLSVPSITAQGSVLRSFFEGFYLRIHVVPSDIDFGNIVAGQVQSVYMWNAFFTEKTMTSFSYTASSGITISGQNSPYDLGTLEEIEYTIELQLNGSPTINDSMTWVIDGEVFELNISGTRVVEFLFKPNWKNSIKYRLEWLTDVLSSFRKYEQRRGLRSKPRVFLEYQSLLTGDDLRRLHNRLFGWQNRPFAVPLWHQKAKLTSPASAGDQIVYLQTEFLSLVAGSLAIVYESIDIFEVVEVSSITSNSISIKKQLTLNWAAGSKIYPAIVARLPKEIPTRRKTSSVVEATFAFSVDPGSNTPGLPQEPAATIFDGFEVITKKPNWVSPVGYDSILDSLIYDTSVGLMDVQVSDEFPTLRRRVNWLLKSRSEIHDFLAFLERRKGKLKTCLMPTWFDDGVVKVEALSGSSAIIMDAADYERFVGANVMQEYLSIESSGLIQYFKITSITAGVGAEITVGLSPNLTSAVAVGDSVTLIHKCRMSADSVTIENVTDAVAQVTLTLESVVQ